ncbi:DUF1673 family protein [Methanococcoides sp. SA1]|nr:DUF1673 family protein [Methanococcoides sp. SA1]
MNINVAETIRKVMGWCPNATAEILKSSQQIDFVNTSLEPSRRANAELFRTENIQFPTNSILVIVCLTIGFNLLFRISSRLDFLIYLIGLTVFYIIYYFIVSKSLQASILITDSGVHLSSIALKNIRLDYKGIGSVLLNKLPEYSHKTSTVLKLIGFAAVFALVAYSVMLEEWRLILSMAPLLPLHLIAYQKQKQKQGYCKLNTQVYIEYKNKKWYKLRPYYSLVTDEITASKIQDLIEHYREAQ